jgi:hypothetical protein
MRPLTLTGLVDPAIEFRRLARVGRRFEQRVCGAISFQPAHVSVMLHSVGLVKTFRLDLDQRSGSGWPALFLPEDNLDRFRVVVRDESGIAELVDNRLAATSEVVGVKQSAGAASNADRNAWRAARLALSSTVQCWPSKRLRLGVR